MGVKTMNGAAYPQPTKRTTSLASTAPSASNSSKQQLFNSTTTTLDVALRKASITSLEKKATNLLRESAPLSFARPAMAAPNAGYRSVPACKEIRERAAG